MHYKHFDLYPATQVFYIEMITEIIAVIRNNAEQSLVYFVPHPCRTVVQYHSQGIDIGTICASSYILVYLYSFVCVLFSVDSCISNAIFNVI